MNDTVLLIQFILICLIFAAVFFGLFRGPRV